MFISSIGIVCGLAGIYIYTVSSRVQHVDSFFKLVEDWYYNEHNSHSTHFTVSQ